MATEKDPKSSVIQAAGGLLWRETETEQQVAVMHRQRYDDWSLPKGKLHKGEAWEAAALREVEEETDCQVRLGDFAGCTCYEHDGRPKVVLYWHMSVIQESGFVPDEEVDRLVWLFPEVALEVLSHDGERELLTKAKEKRGL